MRKIKFRAWDGEHMLGVFLDRHNDFLKDDMPVMQYTGLKDKNGKEIYEGDIVVTDFDVNSVKKGWEFTVEWTTGIGVGLVLYGVGKYIDNHPVDYMDLVSTYFNDQDSEIFEVIGNIYEDSDLIKEKN